MLLGLSLNGFIGKSSFPFIYILFPISIFCIQKKPPRTEENVAVSVFALLKSFYKTLFKVHELKKKFFHFNHLPFFRFFAAKRRLVLPTRIELIIAP